MKRESVETSFRSALKMWSDAAPLTFLKVNHGKADIVLSFARRSQSAKHFTGMCQATHKIDRRYNLLNNAVLDGGHALSYKQSYV